MESGGRTGKVQVDWAEELSEVRFGDKRLDERFIKIMEKLSEQPEASINGVFGEWCEAKAAYRIFSNKKIKESEILETHRGRTLERAKTVNYVVVAQDTSSLNFTNLTQVEGMGSIAQGKHACRSRGLFMHTAYALSPSGEPLGVMDQLLWSREKLSKEDDLWYTESNKWKLCLKTCAKACRAAGVDLITVCDREGDFWDLMSAAATEKSFFVIRSRRMTSTGRSRKSDTLDFYSKLEQSLDEHKLGQIEVEIENRPKVSSGEKKYRPPGKTEKVQLALSCVKVDLRQTHYHTIKERVQNLEVWAVRAKEINPPKAARPREPVDWLIKTNIAVNDLKGCEHIVSLYKLRWQVETFHKVMKSGCQVEKARLSEVDRLTKYIVAMSLVAFRIQKLTYFARLNPDAPCSAVLKSYEWKALYCKKFKTNAVPDCPPSTEQAVRWIAQLGGFLARKSDGPPGVQSIWRGYERLTDMAEMYQLLTEELILVGKR